MGATVRRSAFEEKKLRECKSGDIMEIRREGINFDKPAGVARCTFGGRGKE